MYSVLVLSVINDAQFLLFGQYCKQLLYTNTNLFNTIEVNGN